MADEKIWPGQDDAPKIVDHGALAAALKHIKEWVGDCFKQNASIAPVIAKPKAPTIPPAPPELPGA